MGPHLTENRGEGPQAQGCVGEERGSRERSGLAHLQQVVRRVVQQQHERADAQQVGAVGEGDEGDGHHVVCHLLLEVLRETMGNS